MIDSLTRSQQFLFTAVTEGKKIFDVDFYYYEVSSKSVQFERKHAEEQKDMNDLPSLGFVRAIKLQTFTRHAETGAVLYSNSLA
jgi:hypothetical protein